MIKRHVIKEGGKVVHERIRGLGDVVALGAKPIARAIDAVLKTKLAECANCEERRELLNKAVPFKPKS